MMTNITIHLIGTGNVAWHLAQALGQAGLGPERIYGRDHRKAAGLAKLCQSKPTDSPGEIARGCDMLILCVSDRAIEQVLQQVRPDKNCMLVHTGGSTDIGILKPWSEKRGVLYPLQTFTRGRALPFADVPLFIEAAGPGTREMLSRVAVKLSTKVHWLASSKRAHLHLAAVFACNYINYMYTQAGTILQNAGQDFGILAPLIRETAEKAIDHGPANSQTGPAIREDKATLGKHSQMLSGHPDIKKLYIELAEMIMKSKPGKNKKT